jgi:hypothetical protein
MAEQERDYEAEASKEGWVPKEQWKGDPEQHKTAQQFVEDGEKIIPIMRGKVERLEGRVDQLLQSNRQLNERTQRSIEKEKQENARLIKELEAVRKQAITESDGDAFDRADRQIQELREVEQPFNDAQPDVEAFKRMSASWVEKNPWYSKNRKLRLYADGLADEVIGDGYRGQRYFDELTRRIKEDHPEEFGNKTRNQPTSVEVGGEREVVSGERTFANLPADAKKEFKQFEKDIPGFTKEQFLEQYEWDQTDQVYD